MASFQVSRLEGFEFMSSLHTLDHPLHEKSCLCHLCIIADYYRGHLNL